MTYEEFASKISFYEFIQGEFHKPTFKSKEYSEEFKILRKELTIDSLTKALETHPRIFDIFEQIFQLKRFTNAQYIHFCFDVNVLNNYDEDNIFQYANKSIFTYENGTPNELFNTVYNKHQIGHKLSEEIFAIKKSIPIYVDHCLGKRKNFYFHLTNSVSSRLRVAKYLVENLMADDYLKAVDVETYLSLKRIPKDTKGIHGKFGTIKVESKLISIGMKDVSSLISAKTLPIKKPIQLDDIKEIFTYVKEKSIESIQIRKSKKLKKFDFIILKKGLPVIAIETNFYSTTGTKIGINVGEYTDLNEDIKNSRANIKFVWITDGNFWLTHEGEKLFQNIKENYFTEDVQILNYNLITHYISNYLNTID